MVGVHGAFYMGLWLFINEKAALRLYTVCCCTTFLHSGHPDGKTASSMHQQDFI